MQRISQAPAAKVWTPVDFLDLGTREAVDHTLQRMVGCNELRRILRHAQPGSYRIMPAPEMVDALKRDYQAMAGMIFGEVPNFMEILETVRELELVINSAA